VNLKEIFGWNQEIGVRFELKPNFEDGGVDLFFLQLVRSCKSKKKLLVLGYKLFKAGIVSRQDWIDFRNNINQTHELNDDVEVAVLKICEYCRHHVQVVSFVGDSRDIITVGAFHDILNNLLKDGVITEARKAFLLNQAEKEVDFIEVNVDNKDKYIREEGKIPKLKFQFDKVSSIESSISANCEVFCIGD
jgi:hypothetical protein